ncbi:MAG: hypothetical protein IPH18_09080 [Chitinophagaceae bacterium]|nr:hypothetical protein [Chitinophagaceae bacterium]
MILCWLTYSQFNSPEKKPEKPNFLRAIADDNIFIMDEAHNSSGSSNTGEFLQGVVAKTKVWFSCQQPLPSDRTICPSMP